MANIFSLRYMDHLQSLHSHISIQWSTHVTFLKFPLSAGEGLWTFDFLNKWVNVCIATLTLQQKEEWLPDIPSWSILCDSILQMLSFKITSRCFTHLLSTFLKLSVFNRPPSDSNSNYSSTSVPFITLVFCW